MLKYEMKIRDDRDANSPRSVRGLFKATDITSLGLKRKLNIIYDWCLKRYQPHSQDNSSILYPHFIKKRSIKQRTRDSKESGWSLSCQSKLTYQGVF